MAKRAAFGAVLNRAGTAVVNAQDIGGPQIATNMIEVTSHDSTGAWKEFVAGLVAAGEVSFTLIYDPDSATHTSIKNDASSRASVAWTLVHAAGTIKTWTFTGFVSKFEVKNPLDEAITADVTITITGSATIA